MSIAIRSNTNTMKGWTFACFNITDRQTEFSLAKLRKTDTWRTDLYFLYFHAVRV